MIELSILIPSIPSRISWTGFLFDILQKQAEGKPVEILSFTDNKKRSVGLKRDGLVQLARGAYLSFVDDDDEVYPCYVDEMLAGCTSDADVIAITQHASIEGGNRFVVDFGIDNPNEEAWKKGDIWQDIKRKPFHTCAWKTKIAQKHRFPDASYGEDWHWCKRVLGDIKTEHKIKAPLLCYRWSASVTEAEHIFPED